MQAIELILLIHMAATWIMVGVIWFVQIVHYPLFRLIGRDEFSDYQLSHIHKTSQVVLVPMFIEMGTGGLLVLSPPADIPRWLPLMGMGMLLIIWALTGFVQVPQHDILTSGFDEKAHRTLLLTNWLRTALWSARGILVLYMLTRLLSLAAAALPQGIQ